jgi:long-chain acyl-CoA synthetase
MDRVWQHHYDPEVPHSIEYPHRCLPECLEENARSIPEKPATEFLGATLTYRELFGRVLRFANALNRLGIGPGVRVAVMLPNCPQSVIAYYAVLWLGAVAVMTNPLYVERELEHQWTDSEAEALIVLDHLYPKARSVLPKTRIHLVIATSLKEYLPFPLKYLYPLKAWREKRFTAVPYDGKSLFNFSELIGSAPSSFLPCGAEPGGLALLQYTGGTTGKPKGAMLTHANILANVLQLVAWFPGMRRAGERFLGVLPFFHVFGMTVAMNMPVYTGCAMLLLPRFDPEAVLKAIHKLKPSLFPAVPAIFSALLANPHLASHDLSSIRYCITGAAPMPLDLLKKFEEITGSVIVEGYGLSEASPVTHANPLGGVRKVGSIGLALPDTGCRIVDRESGAREAAPGEVGELTVRGPQVMQSYWKNEQETADALRGGWLHTGDLATMDADGYVFIVDRKKDLIISGGYNIYPREIEEVLFEHPKIAEAAAVGVSDSRRGEVLKVLVVPRPGVTLSSDEVAAWCRERLAPYKLPKEIELRSALPKTVVGKVLRRELRAAEARGTRPVAGDGREIPETESGTGM